ncbi:hypothetical protein LCGC14_2922290 [marine sediment metagenome]|uniref:Uncharacterized protein n=1 Tax=marine sediment metagenome TaxID=412755 RepID=A0A0F8XNR2_9ZZZZ
MKIIIDTDYCSKEELAELEKYLEEMIARRVKNEKT